MKILSQSDIEEISEKSNKTESIQISSSNDFNIQVNQHKPDPLNDSINALSLSNYDDNNSSDSYSVKGVEVESLKSTNSPVNLYPPQMGPTSVLEERLQHTQPPPHLGHNQHLQPQGMPVDINGNVIHHMQHHHHINQQGHQQNHINQVFNQQHHQQGQQGEGPIYIGTHGQPLHMGPDGLPLPPPNHIPRQMHGMYLTNKLTN
jgi:hypothetical protein